MPPILISPLQIALLTNTRATPSNSNPVLLFSSGYGNSCLDYTALLPNLASHGDLVIGINHPYDTAFISYHNNWTAIKTHDTLNNAAEINTTIDIHAQDACFVLGILSLNTSIAKKIPGIHSPFNVYRVGILGHSLGDAMAACVMFVDSRSPCGVNMDGAMFGLVLSYCLSNPFLLIDNPTHNRTEASVGQHYGHIYTAGSSS